MIRAIGLLALAAVASAQEDGAERYVVPGEIGAVERPEIFLRTPDELPRAEPGAWDAFSDVETRPELLAGLGDDVIQAMARAEEDYVRARYPDALEELYWVLERRPDLPPALMLLGTTYFRLRRYQDCAAALERFLEVAPGEVWRTQALAHAYYSLGDHERARRHYEHLIASTPEDVEVSPEALRGLALCHMRQGDAEQALALLDRVIALRPDHAEAHTFRARILYDEQRLEEALEAADRARELAAFDPQPWYFTTRILFDLGRDEEAEEAERRWRELDRVAQEERSLEMQLRYRPGSFPILLQLTQLSASIGDVVTVRARLADLVLARPPELPEVDVRILVLDVLESLDDQEGAKVAALALESTCADERAAWKRLERYYAMQRDRVNQVRCAAEAARLAPAGG